MGGASWKQVGKGDRQRRQRGNVWEAASPPHPTSVTSQQGGLAAKHQFLSEHQSKGHTKCFNIFRLWWIDNVGIRMMPLGQPGGLLKIQDGYGFHTAIL